MHACASTCTVSTINTTVFLYTHTHTLVHDSLLMGLDVHFMHDDTFGLQLVITKTSEQYSCQNVGGSIMLSPSGV